MQLPIRVTRIWCETLRAAEPKRRRKLLIDLIKNQAAHVLGVAGDEIPDDQPLGDLGLDSLMAFELSALLESKLNNHLPFSSLQGNRTVRPWPNNWTACCPARRRRVTRTLLRAAPAPTLQPERLPISACAICPRRYWSSPTRDLMPPRSPIFPNNSPAKADSVQPNFRRRLAASHFSAASSRRRLAASAPSCCHCGPRAVFQAGDKPATGAIARWSSHRSKARGS